MMAHEIGKESHCIVTVLLLQRKSGCGIISMLKTISSATWRHEHHFVRWCFFVAQNQEIQTRRYLFEKGNHTTDSRKAKAAY